MFSVVFTYTITVHKSQSLILNKMILDISIKDHSFKLTYVAIFCVQTIQSLMFKKLFHIFKFLQTLSVIQNMQKKNHQKRAHQCIS